MNLDMDALRTFLLTVDLGTLGRAADRIGRSQSAASQQLTKLEEQLGADLFRKEGRLLVPTPAGEGLLGYARRILALNDEAVIALRERKTQGSIRLGLPQDLVDFWVPTVLASFARDNPAIQTEIQVERSRRLIEDLSNGRLDVAVAFGTPAADIRVEKVVGTTMEWIGPAGWTPPEGPLPLVVFDQPCIFRHAATDALDRAGRPWRIAMTSAGLSGVWATLRAGLGITVRTQIGLPECLRVLRHPALPRLPEVPLAVMVSGAAGEAASLPLATSLVHAMDSFRFRTV